MYLAVAEELKDFFSSAELSDFLARRGIQWQFVRLYQSVLPGLVASESD